MERREMDKDYCEVLPVTSPISPTSPTFSLAPTVKESANDDYMEMIAHVNQCPYHAIGCLAGNIPNLQHHMDSHFSKHLELSQKHIETLKDRERVIMKMEKDLTDKADAVLSKEMMLNAKEQEHATFKRRLEEQDVLLVVKNDEIRNLCNKIDELKKAKTSKELYVNLNSLISYNKNEHIFTMTEVSQYCKGDEMLHWESDVFYTHNEGYKMIFLVDFVLNSLRLSLCILPGEYDDKLPWPLRGMIKISLLNQRNDFNHYSYDFIYKDSTSDLEAGRVLECQGRSKKNVSISRKLTVDELLQSVANKTSYLENNMINFSVSYIDLTFVNSSPGLAVTNTLC
jgi:flagellar biosynthesis regulator FlbT